MGGQRADDERETPVPGEAAAEGAVDVAEAPRNAGPDAMARPAEKKGTDAVPFDAGAAKKRESIPEPKRDTESALDTVPEPTREGGAVGLALADPDTGPDREPVREPAPEPGAGPGARPQPRTPEQSADKAAAKTLDPLGGVAARQTAGPGGCGCDGRGGRAGAEDDLPADAPPARILGHRLALAREHAGLSIEEAARLTRVRGTMIRQIEAGDFSRCGGDIYARGHVRALARVAGVDPEPLLQQYPPRVVSAAAIAAPALSARRPVPGSAAAAKPPKAAEGSTAAKVHTRIIRPARAAVAPPRGGAVDESVLGPPISPATRDIPAIGRAPKSANWTAAMLVVLLGLVVFAGMQLISGKDKTGPVAVKAPAPKPAAAAPKQVKSAVPVVSGVTAKFAAVNADSWLSVYSSDGKKLYDALLHAGGIQTFQDAKNLGVTVGNAQAVHVTLNGKDLPQLAGGGNGAVVHFTVNPGGIAVG